jgi:hypothetical protein
VQLGGYWVREDARGQGLARAAVHRTLIELAPGERAYCLPFDHLVAFYASCGMRRVAEREELPAVIRERVAACAEWHTGREGDDHFSGEHVLAYDADA